MEGIIIRGTVTVKYDETPKTEEGDGILFKKQKVFVGRIELEGMKPFANRRNQRDDRSRDATVR
jgi:hypothetical protein